MHRGHEQLEDLMSIPRRIVSFHRDDQGDWVARLECGHNQHVRHNAPWFNRPWVVSGDGREAMLGQTLSCHKCATGAPPDSAGAS
jgi:hypothetical protein